MRAEIFDIKHFAIHDGPGIRTTVFFKTCPLKCLWCHNPEGISQKKELSFLSHKCINCQRCGKVCEKGVHLFGEKGHVILRENCIFCGKCAEVCDSGALNLYGKSVTLEEVLNELLEDKDFYADTGGVTLSGGECLMQADFCRELLKALKREGIHTAVDTCGFVKRESLDKIIPYTDLFLYDIKAFSEDVHIKCTGVSNKLILENIEYLDSLGCEIEVRIPYVPDCNKAEIEKIAEFLAHLKSVKGARVLPYHDYAKSKYLSLGISDTSPKAIPSKEEITRAEEILSDYGLAVLK